ncbi:hypothetical protein PoB_002595500 [Plakobranchus ocellatus]|uniref:Uncharacterized protein n=1 Tax=Plakobranchus ocellatus TaxID=259542 RepID=A0AAV3ZW98_9GAST|nr:hypothetical protein PoB_002595500 [Plakobranchus ocellatus]
MVVSGLIKAPSRVKNAPRQELRASSMFSAGRPVLSRQTCRRDLRLSGPRQARTPKASSSSHQKSPCISNCGFASHCAITFPRRFSAYVKREENQELHSTRDFHLNNNQFYHMTVFERTSGKPRARCLQGHPIYNGIYERFQDRPQRYDLRLAGHSSGQGAGDELEPAIEISCRSQGGVIIHRRPEDKLHLPGIGPLGQLTTAHTTCSEAMLYPRCPVYH